MTRTRCLLAMVLFTGCQSLENRLVFHPVPGRTPDNTLPKSLENVELRTTDGTKFHAQWRPRPQAKGVILYCYGNAGNLEHRGGLARDFSETLDRSVLMFDYPGFGGSSGTPDERGCYAAADAAYDWLTQTMHVPADRIVIVGESLGGGVAVELASRRPHQALVLIRTFTSAPDVARGKALTFSAAPVMVNRFESLKRIPSCRSPILIAHGDQDKIIPLAHAERLREACKAPVQFHLLKGLGHNDPLPRSFFVTAREFLEGVGGVGRSVRED